MLLSSSCDRCRTRLSRARLLLSYETVVVVVLSRARLLLSYETVVVVVHTLLQFRYRVLELDCVFDGIMSEKCQLVCSYSKL